METKHALSTTIATVAFIVVTFFVIAFMDNNTARNLAQGLILMCSLLLFAGIVVMRNKLTKVKV